MSYRGKHSWVKAKCEEWAKVMVHSSCPKERRAAANAIYRAFYHRLTKTAWHAGLRNEDIKDAAITSLEKAFATIDSYDSSRGSFYSWVVMIGYGVAIDIFKLKKYHKKLIDDIDEDVMISVPQRAQSTLEHIIVSEKQATVRKAILSLKNNEHRQAITMYYLEQRSYKEIAKRLRVTITTIKLRIHRAKLTLQRNFVMDRSEGRLKVVDVRKELVRAETEECADGALKKLVEGNLVVRQEFKTA